MGSVEQDSLLPLVHLCKEAFAKEFGSSPTLGSKAPGRVNIIGEHTDYNDGFVFPMVCNTESIQCSHISMEYINQ
jgi:galactokinase